MQHDKRSFPHEIKNKKTGHESGVFGANTYGVEVL